jgi:hypothetical protein
MAFSSFLRRSGAARAGALALVAGAAAAAACSSDADVRGLTAPAATNAGVLLRYVAIGNSITAGFQSGGINDSTQRASFANLLARAAGVRFAYPALAGNGCPAPLTNLLAGTRVGGAGANDCGNRLASSELEVINNVAVPGANSFDPTGRGVPPATGAPVVGGTGGYSALTRTLLGNATQVQKAVQANPTFASVWIGNNDVLSFAINGTTTGATTAAAFATNYGDLVNQLRAGSPGLRGGVLIGVVDVTNTPQLFQLSVFNPASTATGVNAYNPAGLGALRALFGVGTTRPATYPITFNANCNASQAAISLQSILTAAATAPAAGFVFNCAAGAAANPASLLDDVERQTFVDRVAAYNTYIRAKADSVGFFYYNPNVRLSALRATGAVPPFVNPTPGARPFGPLISLDGVHPATAIHVTLASDLRDSINARFGATIPAIDTTGLWAR